MSKDKETTDQTEDQLFVEELTPIMLDLDLDGDWTDKTEDQLFVKEKLTAIGSALNFVTDSTARITPYYVKESNLAALLDILRLPQAQFITELNLSYIKA